MAKPERISVAYFMKHHVKHSVRNVFLVILIVSVQACGLLYSQNPGPGPTRQSSLEAYSKGDYEKAYNQFSELLSAYPKDPLYLYYTGVCLVQLRREPPRAISLLKQAKPTPVQLRNVPTDVTFWLGRAQQMNGNFEDAITTFEEFTSQAGKKTAREMMVPEYIEQCRQKSGSITKEPSKVITTDQIIAPLSETVPENSVTEITPVRQSARTELPAKSDSVTGISKDYEMLLADALEYQARADSMARKIIDKEKQIEKLPYSKKVEEREAIAEEKIIADSLQTEALNKFDKVQKSLGSTSLLTGKQIVNQDTLPKISKSPAKSDSINPKNTAQPLLTLPQENKSVPASPVAKEVIVSDNPKEILKKEPEPSKNQSSIYSVFEIKTAGADAGDKKTEMDAEISKGLIYRIQVAVFRNPVAQSYFKDIAPIVGLKSPDKGVTIYYAGLFRKLSDAGKALTIVRQKGFKDAFITPFMDGKSVSSDRASVLEKEWGSVPLFEIAQMASAPVDTIPPTLSFRVEVMRSAKPVKDEVAEGMRKIAGTKGLDTEQMPDGTTVYLIGSFITWESAESYVNLIIKNGYKDARIGAWLGKKEIPVETAKQLFERTE